MLPTLQVQSQSGSENEDRFSDLVSEISLGIQDPEAIDFDLIDPSKIVPDFDNLVRDESGSITEEAFLGATKILKIQKQIIDLLGARGQVKGRMKIHLADTQSAQYELDRERPPETTQLLPHQIRALHGRVEEQLAKSDNCKNKIIFYEQNIQLFILALKNN